MATTGLRWGSGEHGVEVDEDRAGDVTCSIGLEPAPTIEIPANIGNYGFAAVEQDPQVTGRHERRHPSECMTEGYVS